MAKRPSVFTAVRGAEAEAAGAAVGDGGHGARVPVDLEDLQQAELAAPGGVKDPNGIPQALHLIGEFGGLQSLTARVAATQRPPSCPRVTEFAWCPEGNPIRGGTRSCLEVVEDMLAPVVPDGDRCAAT